MDPRMDPQRPEPREPNRADAKGKDLAKGLGIAALVTGGVLGLVVLGVVATIAVSALLIFLTCSGH
jgi:hypothetical protein